jgi:hypothetical protein
MKELRIFFHAKIRNIIETQAWAGKTESLTQCESLVLSLRREKEERAPPPAGHLCPTTSQILHTSYLNKGPTT